MAYRTVVKSGRVKVTTRNNSKRVAGVWHNGKYHSPKSHFKKGVKLSSTRIKLKGKNRYYYRPTSAQFKKGGRYYHPRC